MAISDTSELVIELSTQIQMGNLIQEKKGVLSVSRGYGVFAA